MTSFIQSKEETEKILRENPELSNKRLLVSIPLIPVGIFLIGSIIWLIISPRDLLQALPKMLVVLAVFITIFAILGYAVLRKVNKVLLDAIDKPVLLSVGFMLNTAFFMFIVDSPFTEQEAAMYKSIWYIILFFWLLFPVIESKRAKEYFSQSKLRSKLFWVIRGSVWAVIFFTALQFVIVDGTALFGQLFNLIMCSILKSCY